MPSVRPDAVAGAELPEDGVGLAAGELEVELCELLPQAATSMDAATAAGTRNLLNEITVTLLSYVVAVSRLLVAKTPQPSTTFPAAGSR